MPDGTSALEVVPDRTSGAAGRMAAVSAAVGNGEEAVTGRAGSINGPSTSPSSTSAMPWKPKEELASGIDASAPSRQMTGIGSAGADITGISSSNSLAQYASASSSSVGAGVADVSSSAGGTVGAPTNGSALFERSPLPW